MKNPLPSEQKFFHSPTTSIRRCFGRRTPLAVHSRPPNSGVLFYSRPTTTGSSNSSNFNESSRLAGNSGRNVGITSTRLVRNSVQHDAGFTLNEVLVVVVIIGVLSALIIPTVRSGMDTAKSAKCVSNIRQLGNEIHLMVTEYGHYPPTQDYVTQADGSTRETSNSWPIRFRDNPCVGCPAAKFYGSSPIAPQRRISAYSANPTVCRRVWDSSGYVYPANISRPSQIILLTDGAQFNDPANPRSFNFAAARTGPILGNEADAEKPLTEQQIPQGGFWDPDVPLIPLRHNGRANILFVDGHVESIGAISELKEKNLYWNY